jgi:hypothetical protein
VTDFLIQDISGGVRQTNIVTVYLPSLTYVGDIVIQHNDGLVLIDLPALATVTNILVYNMPALWVYDNPVLTNVSIPNLRTANVQIRFDHNAALVYFPVWNQLTTVTTLQIVDCASLATLPATAASIKYISSVQLDSLVSISLFLSACVCSA